MANILGEFEVTLDPKGRFMIPAGLKKQLSEAESTRFVLNRGFDKCLTLYTEKQWEKIEAIVVKLNEFNEKARTFKRQFLNGATFLEPDGAGRLLIPKAMLAYANISKDIIFTAQINKMELWDATQYKAETTVDSDDFNNLAGEVLGSNFMNPFDGQ
jgi:MraZ protein